MEVEGVRLLGRVVSRWEILEMELEERRRTGPAWPEALWWGGVPEGSADCDARNMTSSLRMLPFEQVGEFPPIR